MMLDESMFQLEPFTSSMKLLEHIESDTFVLRIVQKFVLVVVSVESCSNELFIMLCMFVLFMTVEFNFVELVIVESVTLD